jgi:hypothetical protein
MSAATEAPRFADTNCANFAASELPDSLACTGLFVDLEGKQLAAGIRVFQPAAQLWSDGADKTRWIYLPEGSRIDTSDPDEWIFPVGTKLFKEFRWKGMRAETRIFWKVADGRWLRTSYRWNDAQTQAQRFGGGDVEIAGDSYHIPSAKECDQCHKGRTDNVLGFEAVLLALPGATGVTLSKLIEEQRLTDSTRLADLRLADDGTGKAASALPWLHVNCGVSCHTLNAAAEAYTTKLSFRLLVSDLHAASTREVAARTMSVGVAAVTPRWSGRTRLVPGSPEDSLIYFLASTRQVKMPRDQMPPIATRIVPTEGVAVLSQWISSMANDAEQVDAGVSVP